MYIAVLLMEHVHSIVLANFVPRIVTADQVNIVVTLVKVVLANVLDLVLENRVGRTLIAGQENILVIMMVKVLLVNVPDLVL